MTVYYNPFRLSTTRRYLKINVKLFAFLLALLTKTGFGDTITMYKLFRATKNA